MSSTVTIEIKSVGIRARSLAQYVSEALGDDADARARFMSTCKAHINNRAYAEFISEILDKQGLLFVGRADAVIEGCFALLFQFLTNVRRERLGEVVDMLAKAITSSTDSSVLRLRVLGELFNLLDSGSESKMGVFNTIVAYAAATKQLHRLEHYFASAEEWATKWGVPNDSLRATFAAIAEKLDDADQSDEAQRFRLRYLRTFETEPAERLVEARDIAISSVVGYIKAPAVSQRLDLVDLRAVKALADDPKSSRLYELLGIFASKGLRDYLAFNAANSEVMREWGIEHEKSLATMRLLTLCSRAGKTNKIGYADIAAELQVKEDDVERWVVRATTLGLIDAKINQLEGIVVITRSVQRVFGMEDWSALQAKLDLWKRNVGALMSVVRDARGRHSV